MSFFSIFTNGIPVVRKMYRMQEDGSHSSSLDSVSALHGSDLKSVDM